MNQSGPDWLVLCLESKAQLSYDIKMHSFFVHAMLRQMMGMGEGYKIKPYFTPPRKKKTFCVALHISLRVGTQWLSHFSLWNLNHFGCLHELLSASYTLPQWSRTTRVQSSIRRHFGSFRLFPNLFVPLSSVMGSFSWLNGSEFFFIERLFILSLYWRYYWANCTAFVQINGCSIKSLVFFDAARELGCSGW